MAKNPKDSRAKKLDVLYTKQHGLLECLRVHQRNLNTLLLQKAQHGIDVPLRLLNEIDQQQVEINRVEEKLTDIDRQITELQQETVHVDMDAEEAAPAPGPEPIILNLDGIDYTIETPYPLLDMTNLMLPDGQIQSTLRFAGGFEIHSVMKPASKGMEIRFYRHGRRVAPVLDKEAHKLLLPLGLHVAVSRIRASTSRMESLEDITPERIAEGNWTLISPSPPQRAIAHVEPPRKTKGYVLTSQITFDGGYEVWIVQASDGQPIRTWFYIGDWNVAPMIDQKCLALSFPQQLPTEYPSVQSFRQPDRGSELLMPQDVRRVLVERFSLEELKTLCFDLEVDFDSLSGEGKEAKARELVLHLQHRDRWGELVAELRELRPGLI